MTEKISAYFHKEVLPPKPKIILFDWDGTLVDTKHLIVEALNETFEKMGHPKRVTLYEFDKSMGHSLKEAFPKIFPGRDQEALSHFYDYIEKHHLTLLTLLPGAYELLNFLKKYNIKMGIISNKRGDILRKEIKHLKLDDYFYNIIGSCDLEKDKPCPSVVENSLLNTGIDKGKNVWSIGDSVVDITCANKAGCFAVLIHNTIPLENQESWHIDLYCPSCADLHETVKKCMM